MAKHALGLMLDHNLEPSPESYKVWYTYVEGSNPDLCRAVDESLAKEGRLSDDAISEIHYQFFSVEAELDRARQVSENLRETMQGVQNRLEATLEEHRDYTGKLGDHSENLTGPLNENALHGIVRQLLNDTTRIIHCNSSLETQLGSSLKQIKNLRSDLSVIQEEALTDALTGLYNRRHFDAQLEAKTRVADETGKALSLLMIDVDHFKTFNDDYGHLAGDEALKYVGKCVRQCVRGRDIPTRFGGEEIALLLPETELGDAATVGNNIRAALAGHGLKDKRTGELVRPITISVGAAKHLGGESSTHFVARADKALYQAKDEGRDRVVLADAQKTDMNKDRDAS